MNKIISTLLAGAVIFFSTCAWAEEKAEQKKPAPEGLNRGAESELEELKARVENLEKMVKDGEVVDELGHKLHPIHSIYGLKISGGLTITAQGVDYKNNRGAGAISADIIMESPVGKDGRVVAVFDFQRGAGLQNLPSFFTSPNGNPTGPNNDIESFNNDQLHIAQFYYEHNIMPNLTASIGQLDPTVYFDANLFANNERVQFLANEFANNPAIEFGGTQDFYGPGARITYGPAEEIGITLGAFEGDGDYVDMFSNPFVMAEVDFRLKLLDKAGNYRFYYWSRQGRPDLTNVANPNDASLRKAENNGAGLSIDQAITETLGIWLRAGVQSEKVAQFDRHFSGGVNWTAEIFSRPNDVMGFGYGATFIGKDYENYKKKSSPAFSSDTEHYMEIYYNVAINEAQQYRGFHISPDIQYIINPGGDAHADKLFIYGIRLQAFF